MMFRAFVIAVCVFIPAQLVAHSWQDSIHPLHSDDVGAVISFLISADDIESIHKPSVENSIQFFREVAGSAGDISKHVERALLMFEAIRLGLYDDGGYSARADIFLWHHLIHPEDYAAVNARIDQFSTWFAEELTE